MQRYLVGFLAAIAGALLGACSHSASVVNPFTNHHAAARAAPGSGAQQGPADLVSAVSLSGSGDRAVSLKFQLGQRPVAGQPVTLVLQLVANEPLEHLEARFHTDDGLDIPQGGTFDPEEHLEAGAAVDHSLTVVPTHEGVFTVMATVTTGAAAEATSRSFVIPIVVGPPLAPADAPAAKAH